MAVSSVTPGLGAGVTLPLDLARGDARPMHPEPMRTSRVTVVIPTLNEERNIGWVLEHLPAMVDEVILVDGRSKDRTVEVALEIRPDIVVVREQTPGKGAALRAAFNASTGDVVVMLDADCSMDPAEIPQFVAAIENGADVAKGSRFLAGGGTVDISALRQLGNGALLQMTNLLYRARFSELCYGYMAFRRSSLMTLGLKSTGFEIETEIVVRALRAGLRITEVPSFEAERRFGVSNLRTFRDGWRVARTVLRERFARMTPATIGAVAMSSPESAVSSER